MDRKDYDAAKVQTDRLVEVLQEGGNLSTKGEADSLTNLLAAGLQSILSLAKVQHTELGKCNLAAGQDPNPQLPALLEGAEKVVKEISHSLYQAQIRHDGGDVLARRTLVSMYNYTAAEYTKDSCKESEARHIQAFSARDEQADHDFEVEELLVSVSNLGMQLKLNEDGLRSLLFSKITGNANLICRGQLTLLGLKQETVKFAQMQKIIESAFMSNSDPKSASRALLRLVPLGHGNRGYLTLQSTIVRWCRLALADIESEIEQKCLFEARCSETFLRCLTLPDKLLIDKKNLDRAEEGQRILNLHGMVRFLTDIHRVAAPSGSPSYTQMGQAGSTIRRVEEEAAELQPAHYDDMQAYEANFWSPRPPGPGRGQSRPGRPRGGSGGRWQPPPGRGRGPRPQGYSPGPQGYSPGAPPWRPAAPDTRGLSRYPALQGAPRPPRAARGRPWGRGPQGAGRGGQERQPGAGLPHPWQHESLGIAKNGCFACAQPRGRKTGECAGFKDQMCPYFGQVLMPGRCKVKGCRGAHQTQNCIGILQGATRAWRDQVKQVRMATLMPPAAFEEGQEDAWLDQEVPFDLYPNVEQNFDLNE